MICPYCGCETDERTCPVCGTYLVIAKDINGTWEASKFICASDAI